MGNSSSNRPDPNNVLIQSFPLDADSNCCLLPCCCICCFCCKQQRFHVPQNFSHHLTQFIPHEECRKILDDINTILRNTSFPTKPCNLCCLMMVFSPIIPLLIWAYHFLASNPGILDSKYAESKHHSYQPALGNLEYVDAYTIGIMVAVSLVPMFIYVFLRFCLQSTRKSLLLNYVNRWNRRKTNGVFLVLGGEGRTARGMTVGNENGGDYRAFYFATWDAKGILFRGFLHVFVLYNCRGDWCQKNGVPFVPPVPIHQQTMEHQIGSATQNPYSTRFQVPDGYTLVPHDPQEFRVPDGYQLVPVSQDLPPTYADSKV